MRPNQDQSQKSKPFFFHFSGPRGQRSVGVTKNKMLGIVKHCLKIPPLTRPCNISPPKFRLLTVKTEGVNGELLKLERKCWSGKRRHLQIPVRGTVKSHI